MTDFDKRYDQVLNDLDTFIADGKAAIARMEATLAKANALIATLPSRESAALWATR
jgi:hypothetical protein